MNQHPVNDEVLFLYCKNCMSQFEVKHGTDYWDRKTSGISAEKMWYLAQTKAWMKTHSVSCCHNANHASAQSSAHGTAVPLFVPMAHSTLLRMQADAEQAAHAAGALSKGCTDWCWRKESESAVDFQKDTFDASFLFFKAPFFFFLIVTIWHSTLIVLVG